jgi:hypothetical protein
MSILRDYQISFLKREILWSWWKKMFALKRRESIILLWKYKLVNISQMFKENQLSENSVQTYNFWRDFLLFMRNQAHSLAKKVLQWNKCVGNRLFGRKNFGSTGKFISYFMFHFLNSYWTEEIAKLSEKSLGHSQKKKGIHNERLEQKELLFGIF